MSIKATYRHPPTASVILVNDATLNNMSFSEIVKTNRRVTIEMLDGSLVVYENEEPSHD